MVYNDSKLQLSRNTITHPTGKWDRSVHGPPSRSPEAAIEVQKSSGASGALMHRIRVGIGKGFERIASLADGNKPWAAR